MLQHSFANMNTEMVVDPKAELQCCHYSLIASGQLRSWATKTALCLMKDMGREMSLTYPILTTLSFMRIGHNSSKKISSGVHRLSRYSEEIGEL